MRAAGLLSGDGEDKGVIVANEGRRREMVAKKVAAHDLYYEEFLTDIILKQT